MLNMFSRGATLLNKGISAGINSALSYFSKSSSTPTSNHIAAKEVNNIFSSTSQTVLKNASICVKTVDYSYNMIANKEEAQKSIDTLASKGVKFHKSTYDILGQNNSGRLQGAIFTDKDGNIIVSLAGTRQDSLGNFLTDLVDDALVAGGFNTYKTSSLVKLNEYILKEFSAQIKNGAEIIYTGHSLGGHSANVGANIMAGMLIDRDIKDNISVTTFDSAGGDTALKNAAQHASTLLGMCFERQENVLFEGPNVTFDSRKNIVNGLDYKNTVTKYIVHHQKHGTYNPLSWNWNNIKSWLNPTKLLAEHGLDNFEDAFNGKGSIMDESGNTITHHSDQNIISLPFDQLLLDQMTEHTSGEGKLYCMTSFNKDTHTQDTRYFYEDQLEAAKQKHEATLVAPTQYIKDLLYEAMHYCNSTIYPSAEDNIITILGDDSNTTEYNMVACAA